MGTTIGAKKGMVIGYLERVPAAVFSSSGKEILSLVGNSNGIYTLHRGKQLFFVGAAPRLRGKLRQHLQENQAGKWNNFSMYLMRGGQQLADVAVLIGRVAYPTGGQRLIGFAGAADLAGLLKAKARRSPPKRTGSVPGRGAGVVPLKGLIGQKLLRMTHKRKTYFAAVLTSGRIKLKSDGKIFDTPSGAAKEIVKFKTNGWHWWQYRNRQGKWVPIDELRK